MKEKKGFIVSSVATATLVIVVFLMSGCVDGDGEGTPLDFETIEKGYYTPAYPYYTTGQGIVINDIDTYFEFYSKLRCGEHPCTYGLPDYLNPSLPEYLNFSDMTVIAVVMGQQPTGGYEIEITDVIYDILAHETGAFQYTIKMKRTSPSGCCMVTEALTYPYHIIKIDRIIMETNDIIVFEYTDETTECPCDW